MTIKVTPEIWIEERSDAPTSSYIYACGNDRGIDIVGDMVWNWGRSDYLEHPEPGTLQFTFKDPTDYWIQRMRDREVIGKIISINTKNDGGFTEWFMFRGRITGITIERGPISPLTGEPRFYLVNLTCADKLADLGNIMIPANTNVIAETSLQRAIYLKSLALSVSGIADFFFNASTVSWPMGPEGVGGRSALDLARQFYGSFGDTMSYVASENNVRNIRRHRSDATSLFPIDNPAVGGPRDHIICMYAPGYTQTAESSPDTNVIYRGMSLSGGVITGNDDILTVNPNGDINRVEITYPDSTVSYADVTHVLTNGDPDAYGRRTITNDSMICQTSYIDTQTLPYLLDRATQEGSTPQHAIVHYDTKHTYDGFDNIRAARLLVEASERSTQFHIYGTPWTVMNQTLAPGFGLIGATMTYTRGRWVFDLTLQNTWQPFPATPLTWAGLDTRIKWGDYDAVGSPHGVNDYYLDTPMMWIDMRFCGTGSIGTYPTTYP